MLWDIEVLCVAAKGFVGWVVLEGLGLGSAENLGAGPGVRAAFLGDREADTGAGPRLGGCLVRGIVPDSRRSCTLLWTLICFTLALDSSSGLVRTCFAHSSGVMPHGPWAIGSALNRNNALTQSSLFAPVDKLTG